MTISSTLSIALSGLTAAARSAETVSSNVANALTDGYGRREVGLSSRSVGGQGAGVNVDGVVRQVDTALISDRRLADAGIGFSKQQAAFYARLEQSLGTPDTAGSLSGRIASFEAALIEASSRPDSETRLSNVLQAAQSVTDAFNTVSDDIQQQRMQADRDIGVQVNQLNDRLSKVEDLNNQIRLQLGRGHDAAGLMDQRQILVDDIASIVPLRQVPRDNGQIALFTTGGAGLLDGKAGQFEFTPVGVIVPEMSIESGALSGLTLNGAAVATSGNYSPIAGGSLSALFQQRDELAPQAQTELDAVARDLVDRFQALDGDPMVAGLFTDAGAAFDPADETGLAGRMAVSALADPNQGGALWRLRAGLTATDPGDVGDATNLNAFADAMAETRVPASGQFTSSARSVVGLAGELLSFVGAASQSVAAEQSYAQAMGDALRAAELNTGVDSDHELQQLLLIEQAYAANARVIQTADDMLQTLLGL